MTQTNKISAYISKLIANRYSFLCFIVLAVVVSRVLIALQFIYLRSSGVVDGGFISSMCNWDSSWYRTIATDGYHLFPVGHAAGDAANWAFFPLFPLLVRIFSTLTHQDPYTTGVFLNTVLLGIALIVGTRYILDTRENASTAVYFILFYTFGPYTFYFSSMYTESLFFLLTICFFYFLNREQYLLMGLSGALASATRNIGVFLVFAVVVKYIVDYFQKHPFSFRQVGFLIVSVFKKPQLLLGVFLVPFGCFVYMAYLGNLTGDPMAFLHIQRAWGGDSSNPFSVLFDAFKQIGSVTHYFSLWAIAGLFFCWRLAKRKRWHELLIGLLFILIPLSIRINSFPRYLVGSFVPMLALFDDFTELSRDKKIVLAFLGILLEFVLLGDWFQSANYLT